MTREEFIKILEDGGYSYDIGWDMIYSYKIVGDKIVVTGNGHFNFKSLETLPPGVEFRNKGDVDLTSLETLPPGVEFNNIGGVYLESLVGGWFSQWKGNIKGIDPKSLLNGMIKRGIFL